MARRFRRRKRSGLWMPVLGNDYSGGEQGGVNGPVIGEQGFVTLQSGANSGKVSWEAFGVVPDYTESSADNQFLLQSRETLHDVVSGNAWSLRRIVGKCFVGAQTQATDLSNATSSLVDVAAGFIVSKHAEGQGPTTNFDTVNPLSQDSAEDPWIWRRRWLLNPKANIFASGSVGLAAANGVDLYYSYPNTNAGYGSVADGPHIDQKTARSIKREERLFFVIAARYRNPSVAETLLSGQVQYTLDCRFFGRLIQQAGNRRNAAR